MTGTDSRQWIATEDELEDDSRVIADVDGREIAIFEYQDEYYAVANHCIHQGGPLCEGKRQGRQEFESTEDSWEWRYDDDCQVIVCPWHAWRFDITTGENVDDDRYAVPTYDVDVEDGNIYVRT